MHSTLPPLHLPRFGAILLRVAGSALLLALVARLVDLGAVRNALARADPLLVMIGVAVHFVSLFLATARWRLFLRALIARPVTYARSLAANLVGNLYAIIIPGGQVVGDGVKAFWIREPGEGIGAIAASIVFDKLLAVSAVGCFAALALSVIVEGSERTLGLWVGGSAGLALATLAAFSFPERLAAVIARSPLPERLRTRAARFVSERLVVSRKVLASGFALALAGQVINAAGLMAFAHAVGVPLGLVAALWMYGLVLLLSTLPVTISGLGLREGAFLFAFALVGFERDLAVAVSLLIFGTQILFALIGVGVSLFPRRGVVRRGSAG